LNWPGLSGAIAWVENLIVLVNRLSVLYKLAVGLVFWVCFPFLLALVLITGRHRRGLFQRLGFYRVRRTQDGGRRIWIHAASIGEVRAAGMLIDELRRDLPDSRMVVTTMTIHGRAFARSHLDAEIDCFLAPLDVPLIVGRAVSVLAPDVYICLETELWPLLIGKLKNRGVASFLLNGRLSPRSIKRYRRLRLLFKEVIRSFQHIGAISEEDRQRFVEIGAEPRSVTVVGNIKDDFVLPEDLAAIKKRWSDLLVLSENTDVMVVGSTHSPEEKLLLPVFSRLTSHAKQLWLIAPRHLDRLQEIEALLLANKIDYDLLSRLISGVARRPALVLVDTIGDLAELYSIATFVFIGGSLMGYGGHNLMEAAIWEKPVFFGPDMDDFKEGARLLEQAGGGFRIADAEELEQLLIMFSDDRLRLRKAGLEAGRVARSLHGAGRRQAQMVLQGLTELS
jgi:3-deoxy-D-manno-octulosonic-acid transferase